MEEQIARTPEEFAQRGLRYTKDQVEQLLEQTEDFVRENPTRAMAYALGAGFVLNRLPLVRIAGSIIRLLLLAFKPAVLVYGVSKLYQAAQSDEER